ncbi:MAG: hypothetical protein H0X30_24520 [Anaerolineae bacterium]|nr:hypothetical protein [Anaerolineae bacterium]
MEQAAFTAFFAVVVYVVGQFIQHFLLEPIQEQRKVIGDVAFAIVFYANAGIIFTEEDIATKQKDKAEIRKLASQLRATLYTVPFYSVLAFLRIVPKRNALMKASGSLIGFSNSLGEPHSSKTTELVAQALGLDAKTGDH